MLTFLTTLTLLVQQWLPVQFFQKASVVYQFFQTFHSAGSGTLPF